MRFLFSMFTVVLCALSFLTCGNQTSDKSTDNQDPQELTVGLSAPDFTLADQNGDQHTLSDYRGKNVILYFYPKDDTKG